MILGPLLIACPVQASLAVKRHEISAPELMRASWVENNLLMKFLSGQIERNRSYARVLHWLSELPSTRLSADYSAARSNDRVAAAVYEAAVCAIDSGMSVGSRTDAAFYPDGARLKSFLSARYSTDDQSLRFPEVLSGAQIQRIMASIGGRFIPPKTRK